MTTKAPPESDVPTAIRARALCAAVCATLMLASPGCGGALAPDALEEVSLAVDGASPMVGSNDQRFFGSSCDGDVATVTSPLAGVAGNPLGFRLQRRACQVAQPLAEATCRWHFEPTAPACAAGTLASSSGEARIGTASGAFDVALPAQTGVYSLSLQCDAGSRSILALADVPVYVTYGRPLSLTSAPEPSWYRLASAWGCGRTGEDEEGVVLQQMLGSLYEYGRENWRYGSFPAPAASRYQPYDEGGGWTSCPWQALVDGDACNFADCYEFSQVFEHIAATNGIGVFAPVADIGARAGGFLTRAGAASLDPRFPGNVDCDGGRCDGYVFNSHSIRFRDGRYYDATFNRVYQDAGEFIAASAVHHEDHSVTILDGDLQLGYDGEGYGRWPQYRSAERMSPAASDDESSAGSGPAVVEATVSETDSGLMVGARIHLPDAAPHAVRVLLIPAAPGAVERVVPAAPDHSPTYSSAVVQGPGEVTAAMLVPYRNIAAAGGAGRYTYRIEVFELHPRSGGEAGHLLGAEVEQHEGEVSITAEVLAGSDDDPQVVGVELADVHLEGSEDDGFTARFRVLVPRGGGYVLQARLSRPGRTLAYSGTSGQIDDSDRSATTLILELPFRVRDLTTHTGLPLQLTAQLVQKDDADAPYEDSIAFGRFFLLVEGSSMRLLDAEP